MNRYYCNTCGHTWSSDVRFYADEVCHEIVDSLIKKTFSYRKIAQELSKNMRSYISHSTVNNLFLAWAEKHAPSLYETSLIGKPSWSGHLQVDGKHFLVNNTWVVYLIAVDIYTLDIPMAVFCYDENTTTFRFLIQSLLRLHYPFRSLTTDLGKGFAKEAQVLLPGIPHQVCTIHLLRYLDQRVPKRPYKDKEVILRFRSMAQGVLHAKDRTQFDRRFTEFEIVGVKAAQIHAGCQSIYRTFIKYQDCIKQFYLDDNIHNNSNNVECIISHLSGKINQAKKFESFSGAYYTMTLNTLFWRLHAFTASRYKERNGKSPLFLAKSQHDVHGNWIDVLLSIKNQSECIECAEPLRSPIFISQEGIVNVKDGCLLECQEH